MTHVDPYPTQKQKHPKGLYLIFLIEMWERFGYYLLTFLLIYYLTEKLNMKDGEASGVWGWFAALVYASPFFGGLLADRLIGHRRAIAIGISLMALGYLLLGYGADKRTHLDWVMMVALGLVIIGNGFFKPNIGTQLGNLYPQGDSRRDAAFGIFYMGVNIGALISPFVGGYLRGYHWSWAFYSAGIGLVFALILFLSLGKKYLTVNDQRSSISAVLQVPLPSEYQDPKESRSVIIQRITAVIIVSISAIFFWMVFHQNGTTLALWAKNYTYQTKGIKPEFFQSANSIFVVVLSPIMVLFYTWVTKKYREVSTPTKMVLGLLFSACAYGIMAIAAILAGPHGQVSPFWLIACYFVLTIGELHLSPLGTSLMTKLAPQGMTAMVLGIWYFATFVGNKLVGSTGELLWEKWSHQKFFLFLAACCIAASLFLVFFVPFLKRTIPKEGKK